MKWKIGFKFLFSVWIFSAVITSCREIDLTGISNDVMIDESLIAPVGEASVNVDDLLIKLGDQDYIDTVGNEIYITSKDSINYPFRNVDLNKFSKETDLQFYPWSGSPTVTLHAGSTIPTFSKDDFIDLGLNSNANEQVDTAKISTATIGFNIDLTNINKNSLKPSDLKIKIEFPIDKVTKADGSQLILNITPTSYGTVQNVLVKDFVMVTKGSTGIPVKVTIDAKTSSPTTVSSTSGITCKLILSQMAFKVLWGKFQPDTYARDSLRIALNLPTALSGLDLRFTNPIAKVTVKTNIGVKLLFNIDYVRAYDKDNTPIARAFFQPDVDTYHGGDSHRFHISKPAKPDDFSTTTIILDKDNGSTNRLFASGKIPTALEYKFTSGVDADPALSFLVPNSKITANVDVRIPLLLDPGSSIEMVDSVKDVGVNLTSSMKDVTINTGTLVLNITNSFPVKATFKLVELEDAQGNQILKDLKTVYSIDAPEEVSDEGLVTKTKVQQLQIELKNGQFDEFKKLKNLKFKITLGDSTSTNKMHFTKANFIKVKAGVYATGTITGNIGTTKN